VNRSHRSVAQTTVNERGRSSTASGRTSHASTPAWPVANHAGRWRHGAVALLEDLADDPVGEVVVDLGADAQVARGLALTSAYALLGTSSSRRFGPHDSVPFAPCKCVRHDLAN